MNKALASQTDMGLAEWQNTCQNLDVPLFLVIMG
jgi:hypothetical protein